MEPQTQVVLILATIFIIFLIAGYKDYKRQVKANAKWRIVEQRLIASSPMSQDDASQTWEMIQNLHDICSSSEVEKLKTYWRGRFGHLTNENIKYYEN